MIKLSISLLIAFFIAAPAVIAEQTAEEIIVWNRLSDNPVSYKILQLALDKTTNAYRPYSLRPSVPMEQGRVLTELKQNRRIHVASFAPTEKRESELLAIRIPVTRGLLGIRVCLIHEGRQKLFSDINNLQQWKDRGIKIGQGEYWPDTAILEANELRVIKSVKYKPLFDMLIKDRFDCFSRSVSEVLPELEKYKDKGIGLEQEYVLIYRLPSFFFVSRKNPKLAQRIEQGLRLANQDGSFDRIINNAYRDQFEKINLKNRKAIYLDNPYLSEKTRAIVKDDSLWLNPFNDKVNP
ncbi:MAG: hypothetical protein OEY29_12975 [Gammaproteobacteria bacterium]|nr:hypothetical protein [Gammaproteobacteria bacterium]